MIERQTFYITTVMGKVDMSSKVVRSEGLGGERVSTICVGKNTGNCIQYSLTLVLFTFCTCCILRCLVCIVVSCLVCIVVVALCILL